MAAPSGGNPESPRRPPRATTPGTGVPQARPVGREPAAPSFKQPPNAKQAPVAKPLPPHPAVTGRTPGAAQPAVAPLPAQIDRYPVEGHLGTGGAGEVYAVRDPEFDREVALKRALPDIRQSRRAAHRFAAEGRLMGQLQHPTIPPVFHLAQAADGAWFYTLLRVRGRTLSEVLRERKKDPHSAWTLRRLLEVFVTVCSGIAYAHSRGVIHRDLKPQNIMLGEYGQVYLLDWGLAKVLGRNLNEQPAGATGGIRLYTAPKTLYEEYLEQHPAERAATGAQPVAAEAFADSDETVDGDLGETPTASARAAAQALPTASASDETPVRAWQPANAANAAATLQGTVLGTPQYMSPEQARGDVRDFDQRADIYALGAILYELLAGRKLRGGLDAAGALKSARTGVRPDFATVAGRRIEPDLKEICERALEPELFTRYGNVPALIADLRAWLDGERHWKQVYDANFATFPAKPGTPQGWRDIFGKWAVDQECLVSVASQGAGGGILHLDQEITGDVRVEIIGEVAAGGQGELSVFLAAPREPIRRHKDDGYCIQFGADHRQVAKLSRNGVDVQLVEDQELERGRTYVLQAEIIEGRIRLEVNGREVLNYRDLFPLSGSRIGLYFWGLDTRIRRYRVFSAGVPRQRPALAVPDAQAAHGQWVGAIEEYDRLAASHPGSEEGDEAVFKAGMCLVELGRLDDARARFDQLQDTPAAALGWVGRSALLEKQKADPQVEAELLVTALTQFKRAGGEGFADLVTRAITRATVLQEAYHFAAARPLFEAAAKHPALSRAMRARAWMALARCLIGLRRAGQAQKVYEGVLNSFADQLAQVQKAVDGLMLGLLLRRDWAGIDALFERIRQQPPPAQAWFLRRLAVIPCEVQYAGLPAVGACLQRVDGYFERLRQQRETTRDVTAMVHYCRGSVDYHRGDFPAAARTFSLWIDEFPESDLHPDALLMLAVSALQMQDRTRFETALDRGLRNHPKDPNWVLLTARGLRHAGQTREAVSYARDHWLDNTDRRPGVAALVAIEALRALRQAGATAEFKALCRQLAGGKAGFIADEVAQIGQLWLAVLEARNGKPDPVWLDAVQHTVRLGGLGDRIWSCKGIADVMQRAAPPWDQTDWSGELTPLRAIQRSFTPEFTAEFRDLYDTRATIDSAWKTYALQARQGLADGWQSI